MSLLTNLSMLIGKHSTMDKLSILVGRLIKSMAPTKYFVKVTLVGRFMPLVSTVADISSTVADIPLLSWTFPPLSQTSPLLQTHSLHSLFWDICNQLQSFDIKSCCMMSMYHKQHIINQLEILKKLCNNVSNFLGFDHNI